MTSPDPLAFINAGPPGATADTPSYLGVPDGYAVPHTLNPLGGETGHFPDFTPTLKLPQYQAGDELNLASASVENLARLQQRFVKAGLIGPKTSVRLGVADDVTVAAYQKLLGIANRYAVTDDQALTMLESAPDTQEGEPVGDGPFSLSRTDRSVQLTDPTTARVVARRALASELGRDPSSQEYRQFIDDLHAAEQSNPDVTTTTSDYDADGNLTATDSTTGGGAPSPEVLADEFVRKGELGTERNTKLAAGDYFDAALAMIGSGGGGLGG